MVDKHVSTYHPSQIYFMMKIMFHSAFRYRFSRFISPKPSYIHYLKIENNCRIVMFSRNNRNIWPKNEKISWKCLPSTYKISTEIKYCVLPLLQTLIILHTFSTSYLHQQSIILQWSSVHFQFIWNEMQTKW